MLAKLQEQLQALLQALGLVPQPQPIRISEAEQERLRLKRSSVVAEVSSELMGVEPGLYQLAHPLPRETAEMPAVHGAYGQFAQARQTLCVILQIRMVGVLDQRAVVEDVARKQCLRLRFP